MCPPEPIAAPQRDGLSFAGLQELPQRPPCLMHVDRQKLKQMAKNMDQLDGKLAGGRDPDGAGAGLGMEQAREDSSQVQRKVFGGQT